MKIITNEVDVIGALRENGQSVNNIIHTQKWIAPVTYNDTGVYPSTVLPDTLPLEVTTGIGTWTYPTVLYVNVTSGTPTGNLVLEGTDFYDGFITETITIAAPWVTSVRAYKTVTKIIFPVRDAVGDEVSVGTDTGFGSDVIIKPEGFALYTVRYNGTTKLETFTPPTYSSHATEISKNWFQQVNADGASDVITYSIPDPTKSYQTASQMLLNAPSFVKVATINDIDVTTTGVTPVLTVPVGKTLIIEKAVLRCTSFVLGSKTTNPIVGIGGNNPLYNDYYDVGGVNFTAAGLKVDISPELYAPETIVPEYAGGTDIKINVSVASDATTEKWSIDIFGFFTDAPTYTDNIPYKLATVTDVDATTVGDTPMYVVPTGKKMVFLYAVVRMKDYDGTGKTTDCVLEIRRDANTIVYQTMSNADVNAQNITLNGFSPTAFNPMGLAGETIICGVNGASDATTEAYDVDLFGYLVDA